MGDTKIPGVQRSDSVSSTSGAPKLFRAWIVRLAHQLYRIAIEFASLSQQNSGTTVEWTGKDLTKLMFEIHRPSGEGAWLELDNIEWFK